MNEKKLYICLLNDSFPPVIDGVARVVENYAKEFSKKGYQVTVATPKYPGISKDYPFEILEFPSLNTVSSLGYVTGIPFSPKYISQFVDRNIDILHVHCPMASCILSRILRNEIDKPIILSYHTKYDIEAKRLIHSKLLLKISMDAIVENASACDEVWAVSEGAAENLRSIGYQGNIVVMRNGVDMPKGKSEESEIEAILEEYGLNHDSPIYLFTGRMVWNKGQKIILDALKILQDNHKPYQMLFAGGGMDFEDIKEYSQQLGLQHVTFAGPVNDRKKLKAIYSTADLFLFPSTFDNDPLVVKEAASSEVGSVLIKGSSSAEGTTDGVNAILIEENAESMANALMNGDIELYHRIGKGAMKDLYLSWQDATARAYERYQYVLEHYKSHKVHFKLNENVFSTVAAVSSLIHHTNIIEENLALRGKEELKKVKEEQEEFSNKIREDLEKLFNRNEK